MTGRDRDRNRDKDRGDRDRGGTKNRQSTFFINGAGIDREVITTDICRYLGNDALVRPGQHHDNHGNSQEGYYITAYRAPTSAQLQDLRSDSQKWIEEKRKTRGNPSSVGYGSSATRAQIWGPSESDSAVESYAPSYSQPQQTLPPQGRGPPARGYMDQPPQQQQQPPQSQPMYAPPTSMGPPPGAGGYRQPETSYQGTSSFLYPSQQPLATANYIATNTGDYDPRRGANERDPRNLPNVPYGSGPPQQQQQQQQVFGTRGESYSTYAPTSGAAPPQSHYQQDFYGRPGPNTGFASTASAEDAEDIDPYGDEMEFETSSGPGQPNNPAPPIPSSNRNHREPQDNPNSGKRRQGHRN